MNPFYTPIDMTSLCLCFKTHQAHRSTEEEKGRADMIRKHNAILRENNLTTVQMREDELKPITCSICGELNPPQMYSFTT